MGVVFFCGGVDWVGVGGFGVGYGLNCEVGGVGGEEWYFVGVFCCWVGGEGGGWEGVGEWCWVFFRGEEEWGDVGGEFCFDGRVVEDVEGEVGFGGFV